MLKGVQKVANKNNQVNFQEEQKPEVNVVKSRAFQMTAKEAKRKRDVVTGTFTLNSFLVYVILNMPLYIHLCWLNLLLN